MFNYLNEIYQKYVFFCNLNIAIFSLLIYILINRLRIFMQMIIITTTTLWILRIFYHIMYIFYILAISGFL